MRSDEKLKIIKQITTVIQHMSEIVEEVGPSFVYLRPTGESCMYVRNGKPDCLIGRILHRMGVSLEKLQQCEEKGPDYINSKFNLGLYDSTLSILRKAQNMQDGGMSWGDVLKSSLAYVMHLIHRRLNYE
jgi:hypothetical protein